MKKIYFDISNLGSPYFYSNNPYCWCFRGTADEKLIIISPGNFAYALFSVKYKYAVFLNFDSKPYKDMYFNDLNSCISYARLVLDHCGYKMVPNHYKILV